MLSSSSTTRIWGIFLLLLKIVFVADMRDINFDTQAVSVLSGWIPVNAFETHGYLMMKSMSMDNNNLRNSLVLLYVLFMYNYRGLSSAGKFFCKVSRK